MPFSRLFTRPTLLASTLVLTSILTAPMAQAQFDLKDLIPKTPPGQTPDHNQTTSTSSDKHPVILKYLTPGDTYWNTISLNKGQKVNQVIAKCGDGIVMPLKCSDLATQVIFDNKTDPEVGTAAQEFLTTIPDKDKPSEVEFALVPKIGGVSMYGRNMVNWGIEYIGLAGDKSAVPTLQSLIDSDAKCTNLVCRPKYEVVRSLWWIGDKSASKTIAGAMENTKCTYDHKRYGAYWLGLWGSKDGVDVCKKALRDEQDNDVKGACMGYLGKVKETSATGAMLRQMDTQSKYVLPALALMGDPQATAGLKETLGKYQANQYLYRIPVLMALASSGQASAWQEVTKNYLPKNQEDMTKLIATWAPLLKDNKMAGQIKKDLAAALSKIKGNDDSAQMMKLALNSALAQMGDAKALGSVTTALDSSSSDLRHAALEALGAQANYSDSAFNALGWVGIGDNSVLPKLKAFYEVESSADLREMALNAALEVKARAKAKAK
jgi:HEAT repeat protein